MISIHSLAFTYQSDLVLENLSIHFETEKTHGIIGLNGSGKTTFFNILAGYLSPDSGEVLNGDSLLKKSDIAYIDAESFFYPKLTAQEFLSVFPATNTNYNEVELAEIFNLPLHEFIENYSTGMKKKLLIISQLKQDKQIYIFDEPFNGLDLESNTSLQIIIELLHQKGKTIFIASHIIDPLYKHCHQIHHLKNKRFIKSYFPKDYNLLELEVFGDSNEKLKNILVKSL